jgi:Trypsin-like peptidase domain
MKKKTWKRIAFVAVCILAYSHTWTGKSEKWLRSRVVKLSSPHGMCSGEQVRAPSGVDYILTAAHCKGLAVDGQMLVTDEEGHEIERSIIAEDEKSDLLLLEGLPNMTGLDVASSTAHAEHVRTFTHGANLATHKTQGEMIEYKEVKIPLSLVANDDDRAKCSMPKNQVLHIDGLFGPIDVCTIDIIEAATSASIVPGSSGGMLVNDAGQLIGVASCSDGKFGYFVTVSDIKDFLAGY